MNIINKVRKSKELERVRTEQLRLASMYAREKKRQEELRKEEDRLQRERIKIEQVPNLSLTLRQCILPCLSKELLCR
jgi:hypothetical protein